MAEMTEKEMREFIKSRKYPDKQFYLDLLDEEKQRKYEDLRVRVVMRLLKSCYINRLKLKIKEAQEQAEEMRSGEFTAENYRAIIGLNAHFNKFNFGIKYEFQSIMLNGKEDGFNSFKTPAELSVGASWQATNWMKIAAGSNIYFKNSKQGFYTIPESNSYSISGSLTFNLPKNWILSGGYSFYKSAEIYEPFWISPVAGDEMNNHQFSFGLGYDFNEHLQLNIGASIYAGSDIHTNVNVRYDNLKEDFSVFNTNFQMEHELSVKTTIGIGLNYSF